MLHNAPVLVRQPDGSIRQDTLGKYLTLTDWRVENIVVSGNLGMRINLAQLAASAPGKIKYAPGNFPGAEFEMRIRDVKECQCTKATKCGTRLDRLAPGQPGARLKSNKNSCLFPLSSQGAR